MQTRSKIALVCMYLHRGEPLHMPMPNTPVSLVSIHIFWHGIFMKYLVIIEKKLSGERLDAQNTEKNWATVTSTEGDTQTAVGGFGLETKPVSEKYFYSRPFLCKVCRPVSSYGVKILRNIVKMSWKTAAQVSFLTSFSFKTGESFLKSLTVPNFCHVFLTDLK